MKPAEEVAADSVRVAAASALRKKPSPKEAARILELQDWRCFYCGIKFGTIISRGGKKRRDVVSSPVWDHLLPYAYEANNSAENFVAACEVCNGIKSSRIFTGLEELRAFVALTFTANGWRPSDDDGSWCPPEITVPYRRACEHCGNPITGGSRRRFCTDSCRAAAWQLAHVAPTTEKRAETYDESVRTRSEEVIRGGRCLECGRVVKQVTRHKKLFCSTRCRAVHWHHRHGYKLPAELRPIRKPRPSDKLRRYTVRLAAEDGAALRAAAREVGLRTAQAAIAEAVRAWLASLRRAA